MNKSKTKKTKKMVGSYSDIPINSYLVEGAHNSCALWNKEFDYLITGNLLPCNEAPSGNIQG